MASTFFAFPISQLMRSPVCADSMTRAILLVSSKKLRISPALLIEKCGVTNLWYLKSKTASLEAVDNAVYRMYRKIVQRSLFSQQLQLHFQEQNVLHILSAHCQAGEFPCEMLRNFRWSLYFFITPFGIQMPPFVRLVLRYIIIIPHRLTKGGISAFFKN